jgi:hypothetical protein
MAAYRGLAWCALDRDDADGAQRHARAAVAQAEPIGDDALCNALDVLVAACRAGEDLEGAWQAAGRLLEAAGRVGGHYRPFYAVRAAVDVALDRGDLAAAEGLLGELAGHAAALDADRGKTSLGGEAAKRRERL